MDLRDEVSCVEHRQDWNPGMRTVQSYAQPRRALKLFIRQPRTQSGDESKKIVEGVLRIVDEIGRNGMTFEYLTGNTPLSDETFRESFERSQGLRFSPRNFRHYRLSRASPGRCLPLRAHRAERERSLRGLLQRLH